VRDAPEVISEELECEFPVSLQTGSSRSLSLGDGRECNNCNKTGELLASSLIGSSMSLFRGLGRVRLKRVGIGLDEMEQFIETDFLCVFAISSSSMLSSSESAYEVSSRDTCVTSPGCSGVK
jgi:hypothetical protein